MSDRLDRELKNIKTVLVYETNKNEYFIKKDEMIRLELGAYYIIFVHNNIMTPTHLNNVNWNNCNFPKSNYYRVQVNQIIGEMIYIAGIGYTDETLTTMRDNFVGWVSTYDIEVIKELK